MLHQQPLMTYNEFANKLRLIINVVRSNRDIIQLVNNHKYGRSHVFDNTFKYVCSPRGSHNLFLTLKIITELATLLNQFYGVDQAMEILNDARHTDVSPYVKPHHKFVRAFTNDVGSVGEFHLQIDQCRQNILNTNQMRDRLQQGPRRMC